ncbi:MAG: hypothetical protein U1B80_05255 [Anaerolineaceae bacterium]|nr:hypothetical protein [Anaerolineaceae bacterium]
MSGWKLAIIGGLLLLAVSLPYAWGVVAAGEGYSFGGFLLNPIDGNSYLAKMQQGRMGSWTFTLPFTAEPGEGTYLFVFYLLLGHLSRWLGMPVGIVFHAARILATAAMLLAIAGFISSGLREEEPWRSRLFFLACFGSGMGWIVATRFGLVTTDFWVAEAYPFLSAYSNAHFPLGIAGMLWTLQIAGDNRHRTRNAILFGLGFMLSALMPFGLVVTGGVLGISLVWRWIEERKLTWQPLFWLGLGGAPMLGYYLWITQHHPQLAVWNAQNVTPSMPVWDLLVSTSPGILLALSGMKLAWSKGKTSPLHRVVLVWFILGLVLAYIPFNLQRRFLVGFYLPVTMLAGNGLAQIAGRVTDDWLKWIWRGWLLFSLPTTLLVVAAGIYGIQNTDPRLFLTRAEARTLDWIERETPPDSLILASPEMGLFIPAHSGRRVLYGHPFETVDAEQQKAEIEAFFQAGMTGERAMRYLADRGVDYIFVGSRERALGAPVAAPGYEVIYQQDEVVLLVRAIRP